VSRIAQHVIGRVGIVIGKWQNPLSIESRNWSLLTSFLSIQIARLRLAALSRAGFGCTGTATCPSVIPKEVREMAPEKGPNRLNMKFTKSGTRLVIHVVRGLPPKLSKDKKTITITFPEQSGIRTRVAKS
jgi:hypothetical protein